MVQMIMGEGQEWVTAMGWWPDSCSAASVSMETLLPSRSQGSRSEGKYLSLFFARMRVGERDRWGERSVHSLDEKMRRAGVTFRSLHHQRQHTSAPCVLTLIFLSHTVLMQTVPFHARFFSCRPHFLSLQVKMMKRGSRRVQHAGYCKDPSGGWGKSCHSEESLLQLALLFE